MRKKIALVASLAFAAALCAGVAGANVTAQAETNWNDFEISATSVRLDDPNKEGVDSGLRFKVDCPVAQGDVDVAYTVVSFQSSVVTAGNPNGDLKSYTTNIPATVWRPDGEGWNAVMLDIPASDYATEITAKAVVVAGGQTYETQAVTSTIAKTASIVLNAGLATESQVGAYVAGKVQSITLDKASATLIDGETVQLSATVTPADYAVVWASDNTAAATVDNTGKVTAVGAGTANITASMGGVTSEACVVTSSYKTVYDFEDGKAPAWIDWTFHTENASKSVENYNGSKALVLHDAAHTSHAFAIDAAYVHNVFANPSVGSLSLDLTYDSTKAALGVQITGIREQALGNRIILSPRTTTTIEISRAEYEAWSALQYEYLQFDCATSNLETTFYIDNLKGNEDLGEAPAWINWNSNYSVNPTKTMVKYNGVAAIKMTSDGRNNLAFEITQAHLDEIFADASVVSYSFDITYESEKGQMRSQMLFGYAEDQPILTAGQTYNYKITRADYNALKGDKLGAAYQFRMTWTTTYATTFYLANFTVNK